MTDRPYPAWICLRCGEKHGRRPAGAATWHDGTCDVCGDWISVTEPRDFGHMKGEWKHD